MVKNFELGDVVVSQKGRDAQMVFAVVQIDKDGFVMIADGEIHPLKKPKKKNVKHLKCIGKLETIGNKLTSGAKVFDSELKSALRTSKII
ncbi:MAG: RNA-binding protein [Clostridia bacterium]|nr:RNA-binding protein [Clostridia bacterium]